MARAFLGVHSQISSKMSEKCEFHGLRTQIEVWPPRNYQGSYDDLILRDSFQTSLAGEFSGR